MTGALLRLPVALPPFFVEACGYRGRSRYVALRWAEGAGELWLTDDGYAVRGVPGPMAMLWRRDGGACALERFRAERDQRGRVPWLLADRDDRALFIGSAPDVWRMIQSPRADGG